MNLSLIPVLGSIFFISISTFASHEKSLVLKNLSFTEIDVKEVIMEEERQESAHLAQDAEVIKEIFQDLAALTETQGEVIKDADKKVDKALRRTKQGTYKLKKAAEAKEKRRKATLIVLSSLGVVGGGVLGGVIGLIAGPPGAAVGIHLGVVVACVSGGFLIGGGILAGAGLIVGK